jgi:hypothetical protein
MVDILEVDAYGVTPWLFVVDVTDSVRGQVGVTMLVARYLVFTVKLRLVSKLRPH